MRKIVYLVFQVFGTKRIFLESQKLVYFKISSQAAKVTQKVPVVRPSKTFLEGNALQHVLFSLTLEEYTFNQKFVLKNLSYL